MIKRKNKVVSTIFFAIGLVFLLMALSTFVLSFMMHLGVSTVISISYIVLNIHFAIGFIKMKKWIFSLMLITILFLIVNNSINLLNNSQTITNAIKPIIIMGGILIISLPFKNLFHGKYINKRVIIFFVGALLISRFLMPLK